MKSVLAVLAQIALSASNYAVFVAMARLLDESSFVAFSTAVGLNMLAYAVAEGGVSYVAPKALAELTDAQAAPLAGAYMLISSGLYLLAMVCGFGVWNALASEPLNAGWVAAYAVFFLPALGMPAWMTSRSIDRLAVFVVAIVRLSMVLLVVQRPDVTSLWLGGALFFGLVVWLLGRGNRLRVSASWPDRPALAGAFAGLREVFVAKTMSYSVYAMLPLLVGVLRGNLASSSYVTAERLKSLYATVFQPVVQSLYLWQFQRAGMARRKRLASLALQAVNALVCAAALLAAHQGWMQLLGGRFAAVQDSHALWLAAGFSVATTALLHLHVFPAGAFTVFRRASLVQMLAFVAGAVWLRVDGALSPVWLLFGGELALLLAVVLQMLLDARPAAVAER